MRLTNKDGTYTHHLVEYYKGQKCEGNITHDDPATQKLGQLEDIEDELGIDLITLFKALREGYWYKNREEILFTGEHLLVPYRHDLIVNKKIKLLTDSCLRPCNYKFVYLRDYGKTWALTKEELL